MVAISATKLELYFAAASRTSSESYRTIAVDHRYIHGCIPTTFQNNGVKFVSTNI